MSKFYFVDIIDDVNKDHDGHLLHDWLNGNMIRYKTYESCYPRLCIFADMTVNQEVELKLRWNVYDQ